MKEEIRERIEKIKKGQVPEGYRLEKNFTIPRGWVVKSLEEITLRSEYGTSKPTNENIGIPVLRMGNMNDGKLNVDNLVYLEIEKEDFEKQKLHKGDLLINRTNSQELVGKVSIFDLDGDYVCASYIVRFILDKTFALPRLVNYYMNLGSSQSYIKTLSTKAVQQANLNPTVLKKQFKLSLSENIEEQQKIATILSTWDKSIELKEKLIKEKNIQKKGLMQRLLTGEIRLPGFSGEWEEVRLGEICNISTGKLDANAAIDNGKYKFFTCSRLDYYIDKYAFDTEALIIAGNGDVGHIKYYKGKFNAYQRTYVLDNFKYDIFYIKNYMDYKFKERVMAEKQSGAMPYIKIGTLMNFKVRIPSDEKEQRLITSTINVSLKEIDLLQQELAQLKEQKRGLMQLLLTGIVRVQS